MPKIIDFTDGESKDRVLIINPNFSLTGREVSITYKESQIPTFKVQVGCHTVNITADTIDKAISEINAEPPKILPTKVIIKTGSTPKTSSPKLKEEAGNWLISISQKAYPNDLFEVKVLDIKEKRRYFYPNDRSWNRKDYPLCARGGHELSRDNIDQVKNILFIIKKHFSDVEIEISLD